MPQLTEEYVKAANRPADVVHSYERHIMHSHNDFDENAKHEEKRETGDSTSTNKDVDIKAFDVPLIEDGSLAALEGVEDAFVISNVLTMKECDDLIRMAEEEGKGIVPPDKSAGTLRTGKRTDNYVNADLSALVTDRVGSILRSRMSQKSTFGPFYNMHTNWRVLRYDPGDAFPAHQDQMDSIQLKDKSTGRKDFVVSSHTLLINLSRDGVKGGYTRFYPRCKFQKKMKNKNASTQKSIADNGIGGSNSTPSSNNSNNNNLQHSYDYAVDVCLPRGWALVFPQVGMIHAGQPVEEDSTVPKYVAQAGVLRLLPPQKIIRPNVFRLGPGLA